MAAANSECVREGELLKLRKTMKVIGLEQPQDHEGQPLDGVTVLATGGFDEGIRFHSDDKELFKYGMIITMDITKSATPTEQATQVPGSGEA